MTVVATDDAILVIPKGESQAVKQVVDQPPKDEGKQGIFYNLLWHRFAHWRSHAKRGQ